MRFSRHLTPLTCKSITSPGEIRTSAQFSSFPSHKYYIKMLCVCVCVCVCPSGKKHSRSSPTQTAHTHKSQTPDRTTHPRSPEPLHPHVILHLCVRNGDTTCLLLEIHLKKGKNQKQKKVKLAIASPSHR